MKILLTTDFSVASENATDYAIQLFSSASFGSCEYFLLHVSDTLVPYSEYSNIPSIETEKMEQAKEQLKAECLRLTRDAPHLNSFLENGGMRETINNFVENHRIDLIVMGSREKNLLEKFALGSTAVEISMHSSCPVLIVPKDIKFSKPSNIAFGSDYKPMNVPREALKILKKLIEAYDAVLQVFHVYSHGETSTLNAEMKKNLHQYFIEKHQHEFYPIISPHTYEGINTFIDNQNPDILTVIPRERTFLGKVLHPSVTKKMAYETRIPLLVLR